MPQRHANPRQHRARIADLAARLIAEHGISDYALAKRKAARQLGVPESQGLPSNDEIDAALILRQELYEPEEQAARLADLRRQAIAVMRVFDRFAPLLTGPVATGAVSEYSRIELEISAESSKEFEQFLFNQGIEFKIQDQAGRMAYLLYADPADVQVRLISAENHSAQGSGRIRFSLAQLEKHTNHQD